MSAFTPGPWDTSPQAATPGIAGEDAALSVVYRPSEHVTWVLAEWCRPDDARHIVQCVNAHDDLLAALQALVAHDDGDNAALWDFVPEFNAARAAIAKATGDAT